MRQGLRDRSPLLRLHRMAEASTIQYIEAAEYAVTDIKCSHLFHINPER